MPTPFSHPYRRSIVASDSAACPHRPLVPPSTGTSAVAGIRAHRAFSFFRAEAACAWMLTLGLSGTAARAEIEFTHSALFGDISVLHEYDSNIFGNNFELSDWHTVITPGLTFVRDVGLIRTDLAAGVDFQRFTDFSLENSEDPFFNGQLNWKRAETKTDALVVASARRNTGANPDTNTRTQDNTQAINANFGIFATEKIGYRLLGEWSNREYLTPGLTSIRDGSVGAEGRYQYSTKLETFLSVGGRWTYTYDEPAGQMPADSHDWKAAFGASGELLPKVTGHAAIGWVERSFERFDWPDQSGLLLEGALDWNVNDETLVGFIAKRDFNTSPTDQSIEQLELSLEARRTFREKITATGGVAYLKSTYIGDTMPRHDEAYILRVSLEYKFTGKYRVEAYGSYRKNNSDRVISEFERDIVGAAFVAKF